MMTSSNKLSSVVGDIPALAYNPAHLDRGNVAPSEDQLPTLILLESCLSEINKARELDRARRQRQFKRINTSTTLYSESALLATNSPCHGSVREEDKTITQLSPPFQRETATREGPINMDDHSVIAGARVQVNQSPSHIDTAIGNEIAKPVAARRMMTDRDILAKAVQARMASQNKNNRQNQKLPEEKFSVGSFKASSLSKLVQNFATASHVSKDAKESVRMKNKVDPLDKDVDQKSFSVTSSLRWTCNLCLKRNSCDMAQCQVCGRNRGFHLPSLAQVNCNLSTRKENVSLASSKVIATLSKPIVSTKKSDGDISNVISGNLEAPKNKAREKIDSYFLKYKLDFELNARNALADDIASTLSYVRSAHSDKNNQSCT